MKVLSMQTSQLFLNRIRQLPDPILLDLGCGNGDRLFRFLEGYPNVKSVGIDISLEPLRRALRLADEKGMKHRVDLVRGDAHFIPIKDGAFNCGLTISVLYLFPDLASIAELRRVISGWVLIIEKTFNPAIAYALYSLVNGPLGRILHKLGDSSFHGNYHLTIGLLKTTLLNARFVIVKEEPMYYIPIPKNLFAIFPGALSRFLLKVLERIEDRIKDIPIAKTLVTGWGLLCNSRPGQCYLTHSEKIENS